MTASANQTLADLLPIQERYYLLCNGKHYARFGHGKTNGLLVFDTLEKANTFCQTVGVDLPEYQPVTVEAEALIILLEEFGSVCVTDGLTVGVGVLTAGH